MKKFAIISLALIAGSILFSACGGSKYNNTSIPDATCNTK